MRPLFAGLLVVAALALSACYTSEKLLLDSGQAATPLAVGHQVTAGGDDKPQAVDLRLTSDHWYIAPDGAKNQRFLFTPLAGGAPGEQRYAYAIASEEKDAPKGPFIYGVAIRRQGAVYFDLPYCDQKQALAAAAAHGVAPPKDKAISPVCSFTDAASLLGALKDYEDAADPKRDLMHLPAAAG